MFICNFCGRHYFNWSWYFQHQRFHTAMNLHKSVYCGFNGCKMSFSNQCFLRLHMTGFHKLSIERSAPGVKAQMSNENAEMQCDITTCQQIFNAPDIFIKHLKYHIKSGDTVKCPYITCKAKFKIVNSLVQHLLRHKKQETIMVNQSLDHQKRSDNEDQLNFDNKDQKSFEIENIKEYEALYFLNLSNFYLKYETKYKIAQSTITVLANDLQELHVQENLITCAQIEKKLIDKQVSENDIKLLKDNLMDSNPFFKMNEKFLTNHKRKSLYKSSENYVAPIRVSLGKDKYGKQMYFYYVPMLETLPAMYKSNPSLFKFSNETTDDDVLTDYFSGM